MFIATCHGLFVMAMLAMRNVRASAARARRRPSMDDVAAIDVAAIRPRLLTDCVMLPPAAALDRLPLGSRTMGCNHLFFLVKRIFCG